MPWSCPTCAAALADDVPACPVCGAAKESWTLVAEKTRALVLSGARARLEARVGLLTEPLPADDPRGRGFATRLAEVCPVLPKAELVALISRGEHPGTAQRLVARVWPRKESDRDVTLAVELAQAEAREHTVPGAEDPLAAPLAADGSFDVTFVCVYGPEDLAGVALEGMELIDVTDTTEAGYAAEVELAAVKRRVTLPTGPARGPTVRLLEVEDICFHTARKVLLPGGWAEADAITGLSVVAAALDHARRHPQRTLLVAGHTDAVGSDEDNLALSHERARNVHLYLAGDAAGWAAHCQEHHVVADVQAILAWAARARGWDCDPGPVDGEWGPRSAQARAAFRARCAEELGRSLPDGDQGQADWEAYAALYDAEVAAKLEVDGAKVAALRAGLRFTSPPLLACGERWPTRRPGAAGGGAADRRVDLLFFDPEALPDLSLEPAGEGIYGEGRYEREYLDVDAELTEPEPPPASDAPLAVECRFRKVHAPAPAGASA